MLKIGQGLFGKIPFRDGGLPEYDRPYLVVTIDNEEIGLLNVSSVAGKEHKLLYPSNKRIIKYKPPFKVESFVKLDSLTRIPVQQATQLRVLHNGDQLDDSELQLLVNAIMY